jgi:hypothetical protein
LLIEKSEELSLSLSRERERDKRSRRQQNATRIFMGAANDIPAFSGVL